MSANAEGMTELEKWYLANPSEVTDSGKNYQIVLKALGERMTGKWTFILLPK